ncbi:hypothetical protein JG687_00019391 [Phytophthora cactorum]|uniref:Uncharacterized protein n=1 Tax=Phytophthora cactorum TaxID=29920 RepID=A0A8T1TN33_9STRA|nr:hypothetical protein JG687_00019391 [Phytophthora cactorum]
MLQLQRVNYHCQRNAHVPGEGEENHFGVVAIKRPCIYSAMETVDMENRADFHMRSVSTRP